MKTKINPLIISLLILLPAITTAAEPEGMPAADALKRLQDGNAKFVAATLTGLNGQELVARRTELTKDQKPFAIIVSCSDSRVPPELIFDVGLGDVFVVRTAGEVVDPVAMGSVEYAVEASAQTTLLSWATKVQSSFGRSFARQRIGSILMY